MVHGAAGLFKQKDRILPFFIVCRLFFCRCDSGDASAARLSFASGERAPLLPCGVFLVSLPLT